MGKLKEIEVELSGSSIRMRNINPALENGWEYYDLCNITRIYPVFQPNHALQIAPDNQKRMPYRYEDIAKINIRLNDDNLQEISFDVQDVQNQGTWNNEGGDNFFTGLQAALADINGWKDTCRAGGGAGAPAQNVNVTNNPLSVEETSSQQNTGFSTDPGAGAVANGFQSFTIAFTGGADGILNGVTVPDGFVASYSANGKDTLQGKSYTAPTTGAVFITTVG